MVRFIARYIVNSNPHFSKCPLQDNFPEHWTNMPLPDDLLRSIGRVAVNFQTLEMHLSFITCGLIGPEQAIGRMVTAQLPFGRLCVLAGTLFEHRFSKTDTAPRFRTLIKKSQQLEEERNQLFHSAWLTDDVSGEVSRLKTTLKLSKGLADSAPAVSAEEIGRLADEMAAAAKETIAIIGELQRQGLVKG